MASLFTPFHRGGAGPPLVLIHGFGDTWRTWELVLPLLERRHEVLAVALAGHAGGPRLPGVVTAETLPDGVAVLMDDAGWETAHVCGNSLGGFVALQLAARGRARSVVGLAPAGGWAAGDESWRDTLAMQRVNHRLTKAAAARADAIAATPHGRRRATELLTVEWEHIPAELIAHQLVGFGTADAEPLLDVALAEGYALDQAAITCPVRMVWGTEDRLLPWPSAAARFRGGPLALADWVELDGVGHCPQLDVPAVCADLILGWTRP